MRSHITCRPLELAFFWLLPGLAMCFTLTFSLSFCSLPSDAITHNPLPHSLTSPTSLNQHKFTFLTFSETQPLYQTPVVQFISLSHAWQHLLREEPIPEKTQHQRQAHLSPAPKSVSSSAPNSAQVTTFSLSLSPSVNPPCSVLYSSKFQCLYFKVFVQVLCFAFVCVSMFFSNFSKHWWVL